MTATPIIFAKGAAWADPLSKSHWTPSTGGSSFLHLCKSTRQNFCVLGLCAASFIFFWMSDTCWEGRCFPGFSLRPVLLFLPNLQDKDILYLFSIQFSSFSCFSSLSKIWHSAVFGAGEIILLFASRSILFSIKRNFSAFWQMRKLLYYREKKNAFHNGGKQKL